MKSVTKQIREIQRGTYGQWVGGKALPAEPTREEIADAIFNRELALRNFQIDSDALAVEFYSQGEGECIRLAKQYHARRIAFFVVKWVGE